MIDKSIYFFSSIFSIDKIDIFTKTFQVRVNCWDLSRTLVMESGPGWRFFRYVQVQTWNVGVYFIQDISRHSCFEIEKQC